MKYYNAECKPWCRLDEKTKQAIRESDNVQAMALDGNFYRVAVSPILYLGKIYRAPMPAEKKLIPLDAKSCPRRPVLTHPGWSEGVELYPNICEDGLVSNGMTYKWDALFTGVYLINGLPASREVDE